MKKLCRGATRGRPSTVTVGIVASVLPERGGTGPVPTGPRESGVLIEVTHFRKIIDLRSPITDNKFRKRAGTPYLLSVIGDLRFVISGTRIKSHRYRHLSGTLQGP